MLLLIQFLCFVAYITFIVKRYGVLPSISDSWYHLPLNMKFLFTLFTWSIGVPMLLYGTTWFFMSGAGLCFVGAAPMFKMKQGLTDEVHFGGATLGIFGALLGIGFAFSSWFPLAVFILMSLLIIIRKVPNYLWWIEIVAFVTILAGLIPSQLS